ncbi:MAG: phosphoglycerate dehydrogenase-like enzyme [Ilumatobacter sp.]|jgi:phosphoglycerate dehydrogenase-like enzyme
MRDRRAITEALRTADTAIVGSNVDERFVDARGLRWVHIDHAGIDGFAPPDLFRGRVVTTSASQSAPAVTDQTISLLYSVTSRTKTSPTSPILERPPAG